MRVQLYINDALCDLEGRETIAASYSISPISDISKRTSFASISFNLPMTNNNREIFESAEVIVNDSTLPYSIMKARLYVDGIDQMIRQAEIVSVQDTYKVRLYGGNVDFFALIKDRKISELGTQWNHVWDIDNVFGSKDNTSGYIYPIIDYYTDSPNSFIDNISDEIDVRGMLPAVFLHSIIDKIITDAGYTLVGDIFSDSDFMSIVIPSSGLSGHEIRIINEIDFEVNDSSVLVVNPLITNFTESGNPSDKIELLEGSEITVTGINDPSQTITVRCFRDEFMIGLSVGFQNFEVVNQQGLSWTSGSVGALTFGQRYKITVDLTFRNSSYATVNSLIYYTYGLGISDYWIPEFDFGFVPGTYFQPLTSIGDIKQSDLLRDTAQKFNLIYQVDSINKIVYARQFSEIIDNKGNAIDWSGKVDYTEKHLIEFSSQYAQLNRCRYSDDETVVKPAGTDFNILINNENLKPDGTLFESPFAASQQVTRFGGISISQIKLLTDWMSVDAEIGNAEPRYLYIRRGLFSTFVYTNGVDNEIATDVPLTHFILTGEYNLGFADSLINNSSDMIAMIQQYKQVTIPIRLTPADINQLDFFTPVWIELRGQPGAYYYISEIKQFKFTSTEATDVELVKLP